MDINRDLKSDVNTDNIYWDEQEIIVNKSIEDRKDTDDDDDVA